MERHGPPYGNAASRAQSAAEMAAPSDSAPGARPDELDMPFDRPSLMAMRNAVAAHASRAGLASHRVDELVLVAHELATNAVLHGAGSGRLRLWVEGDRLNLSVSDRGSGAPRAAPSPAAVSPFDSVSPPPVSGSGGRGLWLARQMTDSFQARSDEAGTSVTVGVSLSS